MQNFSILQLLRALSAYTAPKNGDNADANAGDEHPPTPPVQTADTASENKAENADLPPTHAKENGGNTQAYESFLARHEQALRRIRQGK